MNDLGPLPATLLRRIAARWHSARVRDYLLNAVSLAVVAVATSATAIAPATSADAADKARATLAKATVPWVPNRGQWDAQAAFRAQHFAGSVWLTQDGVLVHQFNAPSNGAAVPDAHGSHRAKRHTARGDWVLTERFVGGEKAQISPAQPQVATVNYFRTAASTAPTSVPAYGEVSLGEMYPGVTVTLKATHSNVEKLYLVAPAADPSQIRMRVDGARALAIGSDGSLKATTDYGDIAFTPPVAFQHDDAGNRVNVPVSYQLDPALQQYGFQLASYDRSRALTIDPLLASTYLGGNSSDAAYAVAVNPSSGLVYVTGTTGSSNFPGTAFGAQPARGGAYDAFIARFSADLSVLMTATYFGSSGGFTEAFGIVINPNTGNVYIAGETNASALPGTAGSPQTSFGGNTTPGAGDAFIAVFNAGLNTLIRASYHGGSGDDTARAIAYHPSTQEVYIAGNSSGVNSLPGVAGGAQSTSGVGRPDCYVTRFNALLTQRLQSTYLSGTSGNLCEINALVVHPINGAVYAAGRTNHPALPGVSSGVQSTFSDIRTGFISRFNAALTAIDASTYESYPGNPVFVNALAPHPVTGDIYLGGTGTVANAAGTASNGSDGFISRFSASLATRYAPIALPHWVKSLAYHGTNGDIYAAGKAYPVAWSAAAGGPQPTFAGGSTDAFVARINSGLTTINSASFLGTTGDDQAFGIAISALTGNVFVVGEVRGANLPGASVGAYPTINADNWDAFVTAFTAELSNFGVTPNPFTIRPRLNVTPSSTHVEGPIQITGLTAFANVSISGAQGNICVSSLPGCTCDQTPGGTWATSSLISNARYLCVRAVAASSANTFSEATIAVGGYITKFLTYTGQLFNCSLDVDGDGVYHAATDGLILSRALMGFTGTAVTNGVMAHNPPRNTWPLIRQHLNSSCGLNLAP